MSLLQKIRSKDWRRLAFAAVAVLLVAVALTLIFANVLVSVVGAAVFGAALLAQRPYLYLRHLVAPKWNPLPHNGWDNYFYED